MTRYIKDKCFSLYSKMLSVIGIFSKWTIFEHFSQKRPHICFMVLNIAVFKSCKLYSHGWCVDICMYFQDRKYYENPNIYYPD